MIAYILILPTLTHPSLSLDGLEMARRSMHADALDMQTDYHLICRKTGRTGPCLAARFGAGGLPSPSQRRFRLVKRCNSRWPPQTHPSCQSRWSLTAPLHGHKIAAQQHLKKAKAKALTLLSLVSHAN